MVEKHYKELHDKLLVKNEYIETIIDNIDVGILTVGPKNYIKIINRAASKMLGLSQEDVLGLKVSDIIENWEGIQQRIDQEIPYLHEETFIKGKHNIVHCMLNAHPIIKSGQFKHDGIVCTITKIKDVRSLANKVMGRGTMYTFDKIIGKNKDFVDLVNYAKQISDSPSTVLITGESGTGKEVFAQSIHNESSRRNGPCSN